MARRAITMLAALLLAACSDVPTDPSRTAGTARPAALGRAHQSAVDAFVAAQGTYCTADGGSAGDCFNLFGPAGPPDVVIWCGIEEPVLCPMFDHAVASRWLAGQSGRGLGATWRGTVQERRLADGRRRVAAHIQFADAIVTLADLPTIEAGFDDQEVLEAGLLMGHTAHAVLEGAPALLGSHAARYEFILPADFAGMPDLVEVIFFPKPGMEFLGFDASASAVGTMRRGFLGVAAGERARISMHFNWDAMKDGALPPQAHANGIRRTWGSPGMHVDLIRMP